MSHRDISQKKRDLYFFESGLSAREKNFEADMLCRIFRQIDWYHSLVPKNFFSGVIQDLSPFLESSFCTITQKRLFFPYTFDFEVPLFFNFLSDGLFTFLGGWPFLKTFPIIAIQSPRSSEFDAVRRIFVLGKKPLLIVNFTFRVMWRIKWRMPKLCKWRRGRLLLATDAKGEINCR